MTGWPALRTPPTPPGTPAVSAHLLCIVLSAVIWAALGAGLTFVAGLLPDRSAETALVLMFLGLVLTWSILFSWVGFGLGALTLHVALRLGWGGWGVVLGLGLAVGALCAEVLGSTAPLFLGPPMALGYAALLRLLSR